jgi:hypothetical protein
MGDDSNTDEHINSVIMDIDPKDIKQTDKCAPGVTFSNGSCIEVGLLDEMASAYNEHSGSNNKIRRSRTMLTVNPQKYKLYLVHEIKKRLNHCTTQVCWTEEKFVDMMNDKSRKILYNMTHLPKSPAGKFEWLSTVNINEVMAQYEEQYDQFKFFGAVPMDFAKLPQCDELNNLDYNEFIKTKSQMGLVLNLDEHYKGGSHWVALFADLKKGCVFYFDSVGTAPEPRVRKLMRTISKFIMEHNSIKMDDVRADYNTVQHQFDDFDCGVYSMNFIIRMARGEKFDDICKSPVKDDVMNKCRMAYFNKSYKSESE